MVHRCTRYVYYLEHRLRLTRDNPFERHFDPRREGNRERERERESVLARKPPVEETGGGDRGALEGGGAAKGRNDRRGRIGEKEGEKEREIGRARKEGGGRGQVACRRGAAATLLG